jgi:hypothetical protein
MASRENQGLHIALILLVMLTIGLCLLSFVFYSKAENRRAEAERANSQLDTAKSDLEAAGFRAQLYEEMISGKSTTLEAAQEELANIPGVADDPEVAQIRRNFENNMKLFSAQKAGEEIALNYQSLPGFLLTTIRQLNRQLTTLRASESKLQQDYANLQAETKKKLDDAEAARQQIHSTMETMRKEFDASRSQFDTQLASLQTEVTDKRNRIDELTTQLDSERAAFNKRIEDLAKTVDDQRVQLEKYKKTTFEVPDAIVTSVNQREGIVYINIGSSDNLQPQQTFSVFDKGMTGVMDATPKGSIEVVQILGSNLALARILEDQVSNVIVPDDVIFTPAWSPGERIHFAIAGFIDITGSGRDETDLLKRLIELNGGIVDDTVTVQTRYLIQGEDRDVQDDRGAGVSDDFKAKLDAATEIGVDRLSVQKLLTMMGWRANVTTVTIGSGESVKPDAAAEEDSPFRKRTPPRGTNGAF